MSARLRAIEAAALACRTGASGDGAGHVIIEADAWWALDAALRANEPPAIAPPGAFATVAKEPLCVGTSLVNITPDEFAALPGGSRFESARPDAADFWKTDEGVWTVEGRRVDNPAEWVLPKDRHWILTRIGWGS